MRVYRDSGKYDCTNNGVSSRFDELFVPCPTSPFECDEDDERLCDIQTRDLFGHVYAELVPRNLKGRWTMMGGNFAGTFDSRFSEMVEELTGYPCRSILPIHDRVED